MRHARQQVSRDWTKSAPRERPPCAPLDAAKRFLRHRRALQRLEEHLGRPLDYNLHRRELSHGSLELPLAPFGAPDLASRDPALRGGRSVAFDPETGFVFVTFLEGQAVMRLGPDGAKVVGAEELHLEVTLPRRHQASDDATRAR